MSALLARLASAAVALAERPKNVAASAVDIPSTSRYHSTAWCRGCSVANAEPTIAASVERSVPSSEAVIASYGVKSSVSSRRDFAPPCSAASRRMTVYRYARNDSSGPAPRAIAPWMRSKASLTRSSASIRSPVTARATRVAASRCRW